ncbi:MAG: ATP-binding protein [Desulfobacterales bacterium]
MKVQKIFLLGFTLSMAVSAVVVLIVFYVIRNMENETARSRVYENIMSKTYALNLSTASLRNRPDPGAIRQIASIRGSLENLLGSLHAVNVREKALVQQIRQNYRELGYALEKLISMSPAPEDGTGAERTNVLISQLWMKNQFIADDTHRLMEISQFRIAAAQRNAGILVLALIFALLLANAAILFFTGRQIIQTQQRLRQALARTEESDRTLRALMEYVPEGITMADSALNLTRVSRYGEQLVGGAQADMTVADVTAKWAVYHADGKTPMADEDLPLVRAIRNGEVVKEAEIVQIDAHGRNLQLLCTAGPIRDAAGAVVGGIVAWRDNSERKQAEEMRRQYNQRLESEVKNRTAEIEKQYQQLGALNLLIKQMAQHTINAMENDRRALSKDIHDSIGGSLAAIKMLLEIRLIAPDRSPAESRDFLEKIIGHLTDTIKESRRISYQMRPLTLDDFGLSAALMEQFRHFREFYPQIEVISRIELTENAIPKDVQTILYRIVQEAMNNIGKHSGAVRAEVELFETAAAVVLRIEDNGCGFEVTGVLDVTQPLQGYGMHGMKERIEICNGSFAVKSVPGKGTLLTASIPKTAAHPPAATPHSSTAPGPGPAAQA